MRAVILGVSKIAMLRGPVVAKAQNEEPLDPDCLQPGPSGLEQVKVDWQLVNEWRGAVTCLKENASIELPNSGKGD
jgi:hypothetical protein